MIKFQNYKHYKLPISINPLEYGKLIIQIEELNLFIVQVNRSNLVLLYQLDNLNLIKFFKEGELILEYKDHMISDDIFVRTINNKKFTFKNNELTLISTDNAINVRLNLLQLLSNFIMSLDNLKIKQYNNTLTQIKWKII
jgi:hypothetical protein